MAFSQCRLNKWEIFKPNFSKFVGVVKAGPTLQTYIHTDRQRVSYRTIPFERSKRQDGEVEKKSTTALLLSISHWVSGENMS